MNFHPVAALTSAMSTSPASSVPYVVGLFLTWAIFASAFWVRLDRDRSFYPTVMLVIASYYDLFGVMGGSTSVIIKEAGFTFVFAAIAVLGFRKNLWFVVAALVGHAVFDCFHEHVVTNPGMPPWWPAFCLSSDFAAAAFLAWRLRRISPGNLPDVAQVLSGKLRSAAPMS